MGLLISKIWALFGNEEHKLVLVGLDNAGKTTILYQLLLGEAVHTRPTIGSNVEEIVWRNLRFVMWDLGGQQSLRSAWNTYYTNSEVTMQSSSLVICRTSGLYTSVTDCENQFHSFIVRLWDDKVKCLVWGSEIFTKNENENNVLAWLFDGRKGMAKYVLSFSCIEPLLLFVIMVIDSTDRQRLSISREELHRMLTHEELTRACLLVFANKQDVKGSMSPAEISQQLDLTSIKQHPWHIQPCCALTGEGLHLGLEWIASRIKKK